MFGWLRKLFIKKQNPQTCLTCREEATTTCQTCPNTLIQNQQNLTYLNNPIKPTPEQTENAIRKVQRLEEIRMKNATKTFHFTNSEHFKQRQPTTARKLWKPNVQLPIKEED